VLIFRITAETAKASADLSQSIILVGAWLCSITSAKEFWVFFLLPLTGSKWDTRIKYLISLHKKGKIYGL
jgi:hypothetical protein